MIHYQHCLRTKIEFPLAQNYAFIAANDRDATKPTIK